MQTDKLGKIPIQFRHTNSEKAERERNEVCCNCAWRCLRGSFAALGCRDGFAADGDRQKCYGSAPVEFAGFRLGQTLDVENTTVRAEWGLGSPSRVVLANVKYEYLDCETVGPTNGWDSVGVSVSLPDKKVVSIDAVAKCKDKESAEQRRKVVVVDFKAKHPSRENEKGDKTFEASVSGTSVDACLSSESFRAVNRKNNELASSRN